MAISIESWSDLDNVRNDKDENYVLENNLSSSSPEYTGLGDSWEPIGGSGDSGSLFTGVFDGDGYSISDLQSTSGGLFGGVGGTVRNLSLKNIDINSGEDTGGITNNLKGTIDNCFLSGSIVGDRDTGAFAGRGGIEVIVKNSELNSVTVDGGSSKGIGGFLGSTKFGLRAFNLETRNLEVIGGDNVGGVVGSTQEKGVDGLFQDIIVNATVKGNDSVGGFAGLAIGFDCSNVIVGGQVGETSLSASKVGGLVGFSEQYPSKISECAVSANVYGDNRVGGLIGFERLGDSEVTEINNTYVNNDVEGNSNTGGLIGEVSEESIITF